MARIYVTRELPGGAIERLRAAHDVDVWPGDGPPPHDELVARAREADALLTMLTDRIDAEFVAETSPLRGIANYAVGTDNIDLDAATAAGVPVGNTPDVLTDATADLAFALLLAAARRLRDGDEAVRTGNWPTWSPDAFLGHDVAGATLGIVGYGRIGRATARRGEGFGMKVLHNSRSGGVALDELLRESDYVSVHAPLTPETRGLI